MESTYLFESIAGARDCHFAYKTNGMLMVLKMQCSVDIKNAYLANMSKSLSPYACAAKSLFGAATDAKRSIPVNQKCL